MSIVVMKFGGGCLRNGEDFIRVSRIILACELKPAVVVSAVYGITDVILGGIESALAGEHGISDLCKKIEDRHAVLLRDAVSSPTIRKEVSSGIREFCLKMERLLFGISYTEEVTAPTKSTILSFGERMSALLLAAALKDIGRDSTPFSSEEVGLWTDDVPDNATALLSEVKKNFNQRIGPLIEEGVVPVLTGFFGCTQDGKITTFGRNGTDYSAAVAAHGLGAERLEIWKDVDGFMTADPKLVPEAKKISRLSYYEAAELAYFGAGILHPRTMEPLKDDRIPILIKNVLIPRDPGTCLLPESHEHPEVIKSVAFNRNIGLAKIHGPGVGVKPGIIAQVGKLLGGMGINIVSVITSQTCINLLIDRPVLESAGRALHDLCGGVIERVDFEMDIALVSVVGIGLQTRKGVAARVFSAVASADINIEMICSGASEVANYFIVKDCDLERSIHAIHGEFFHPVMPGI